MTLVAGAGMNGAQRISAREPKAIEPGKPFDLEVEMHFTSWVFPKGHRIRLSVSNAQWPMNWPTPYATTTSLYLGRRGVAAAPSRRAPRARRTRGRRRRATCRSRRRRREFPGYESIAMETPSAYGEISSVDRNPRTGKATVVATNNSAHRFPWGEERNTEKITHEAEDGKPEKASVRGEYSAEVKTSSGRTLRWESVVVFSSDRENFHYSGTRKLFENGKLVREKNWEKAIPRDFQ